MLDLVGTIRNAPGTLFRNLVGVFYKARTGLLHDSYKVPTRTEPGRNQCRNLECFIEGSDR